VKWSQALRGRNLARDSRIEGAPKLQQTHFSDYTSVLDILHALSYSLAAARAVHHDEAAAQRQYDTWAEQIWQGHTFARKSTELRDREARLNLQAEACGRGRHENAGATGHQLNFLPPGRGNYLINSGRLCSPRSQTMAV